MEHTLKLKSTYFNYVNHGTKKIELRLYDEKRQKISIGDTIIFTKLEDSKISIKVKVIGLLRYNRFEELLNDFDINIIADNSMTKNEVLEVLNEFYPEEAQNKYGVIGIRFKKIEFT